MFYRQCNECNQRWELGTGSTCKCSEQEPVAWIWETEDGYTSIETHSLDEDGMKNVGVKRMTPLYAHIYSDRFSVDPHTGNLSIGTVRQRPWVGLTLDQRIELAQDVDWAIGAYCEYAEKIEAKLKELNG